GGRLPGGHRSSLSAPIPTPPCDIYRAGNGPPSAPDVAGVPCHLGPKGQSTLTTLSYTHLLLVDATVDLRDDLPGGTLSYGPNADRVFLPDPNGTEFRVLLVRPVGRGTGADHKQALLMRVPGGAVPWQTDNVGGRTPPPPPPRSEEGEPASPLPASGRGHR